MGEPRSGAGPGCQANGKARGGSSGRAGAERARSAASASVCARQECPRPAHISKPSPAQQTPASLLPPRPPPPTTRRRSPRPPASAHSPCSPRSLPSLLSFEAMFARAAVAVFVAVPLFARSTYPSPKPSPAPPPLHPLTQPLPPTQLPLRHLLGEGGEHA